MIITEPHMENADFNSVYFSLRKKEGRIYTDEEVARLPDTDPSHVYFKEWQIRKESCNKLIKYLQVKSPPLHILDAGCGNGWLTARLAAMAGSMVTGIDIHSFELEQARRVFGNRKNLQFYMGSPGTFQPGANKFDVIIFASSIQYFPSIQEVLHTAKELLSRRGEIHILDSPLYKKENMQDAWDRSENYFEAVSCPSMTGYYYHHCFEELQSFNYRVLYSPGRALNFFKRNKNPFPWICIQNG